MHDKINVTAVLDILDVLIIRTAPPGLMVRALGQVPTSGWTDAALVPRQYATAPADGIQEFDFVALPPKGFSLQVLSKIQAEGILEPMPDWVKGVRVVAATNELEFVFPVYQTLFDGQQELHVDGDAEANFVSASDGTAVEPLLPEDYTDAALVAPQGTTCRSYKLGSINIPETKTEFEVRCVAKNPFNGKCIVKTKVPIIYRRTSRLTLVAEICVPDEDRIWDAVKSCIEQAVVAGVVAGLITGGNLAAGAAALKAYLVACLKAKLGEAIGDISVNLRREKLLGVWKKI